MKLLALDTATEACSVALVLDDVTIERFEVGSQHSQRILEMVDEVLAETGTGLTQLDALAFGRGPGSFTGLRIGAGVVQGLAFGADLPVVPVSSLAALAQGVDGERILSAFDARMNQVYWGAWRRRENGLVESIGNEIVIAPHDVPLPDGAGWVGAGSGWDAYSATLLMRLGDGVARWIPECYPHARDVARLGIAGFAAGAAVGAEHALPVYIRDEVAAKQKGR